MNWELFASTFAAIFVAELGDKTQLATMTLTAAGTSRWAVFAAAALALVTTTALAVLVGDAVTRVISPTVLRRLAGLVFIAMGLVYLVGR